jgi:hypothetical protein
MADIYEFALHTDIMNADLFTNRLMFCIADCETRGQHLLMENKYAWWKQWILVWARGKQRLLAMDLLIFTFSLISKNDLRYTEMS